MKGDLKNSSKSEILLTVGVVLTVLNTLILLGIIGFSVYKASAESDKQSKLILEDVDPKKAEELNSQLTYSGEDSEEAEYYSPSLDALVKYDSTQLDLSDGSDSIQITIKNSPVYNVYANVKLLSKSSNDPISNRSAFYESIYEGVKKDEEGTVEGLTYAKISYVQEDFLDKSVKTVINKLVVYKEIDNKYLYAEITYPDGYDITQITSLIAKLLNSADLAPEGIDEDIKVDLKTPGIQFSYNKDMWIVNSITDSSASMYFRSRDFEEDSDAKNGYSSIYISTYEPYSDSTVQKEHEQMVAYDEDSHKDEDFKFLKENEKMDIGGVEFLHSEYSYFSYYTYYESTYTGITEDEENIVYINVLLTNPDSVASEQIKEIFDSVLFTEESKVTQIPLVEPAGTVLGTSSIEIDKSAIIGKPAVVHIFNKTCSQITFSEIAELPTLSGNTYEICSAGLGSGFYISKDGYIVTNGHVATPSGVDTVLDSFWYEVAGNTAFWYDMGVDIGRLATENGVDVQQLTVDQVFGMASVLFLEAENSGYVEVTTENNVYVEKDTPFAIDINSLNVTNSDVLLQAEVVAGQVDSMYQSIYKSLTDNSTAGISKPDLAIIKVTDPEVTEFPALDLSDPDLLSTGQKVVVIGYPGSAENQFIFSAGSSRVSTVTNGVISAIKENATGTFKLLQIDASISHGNSGGPILDATGDVVGVATYGISQGEAADFNAGVSVEEVGKFLSDNNVSTEVSLISQRIELGVENLNKEYYKKAVEDFEFAKKNYPLSAEILDPLIAVANDKIAKGEDKTPGFDLTAVESFFAKLGLQISGVQTLILLGSAVALLLSSSLVIILVIRKGRKNRSFTPPVVGNQPITPIDAETQPAAAPINSQIVEPVPPVQAVTQTPPVTPTPQPTPQPNPAVQEVNPVFGNPVLPQEQPAAPQQPVNPTPAVAPVPIPVNLTQQAPTQAPVDHPVSPQTEPTAVPLSTPEPTNIQPQTPVQPPLYP